MNEEVEAGKTKLLIDSRVYVKQGAVINPIFLQIVVIITDGWSLSAL